ncbi:MAG: tyrosine-type recombinase/integrase [Clostridia bacterium]
MIFLLKDFELWLIENERSITTVKQYLHDTAEFLLFCENCITREAAISYKELLKEKYRPASVNTKIATLNAYFNFKGFDNCRLKSIRLQRDIYLPVERSLNRNEYVRLIEAARNDERLFLILQTLCATGIRVSELRNITVETAGKGTSSVQLKGKIRTVILPKKLCRALLDYAKRHDIENGEIFITKKGKSLDRSNIWREMKNLCRCANVDEQKVFPHNLRHLFARTFYKNEKDLVRLADILGHSNINTTRIYTAESCEKQRKSIEQLGLLAI